MWLQRFSALLLLFSALAPFAQAPAARPNTTFVHKPARMFHGNALHEELWVVVNGERIRADSPCVSAPGATDIDSPGLTASPAGAGFPARTNLSPDELTLTVATAHRPTSPWSLTSTVEGMRGLLWPARIRRPHQPPHRIRSRA